MEQLLTVTFQTQMARHKRSYQGECPKVSKLSNQCIHKLQKLLTDYFVDAWVPRRFEHSFKEGVNIFNKKVRTDTNFRSESLGCKLQKTGIHQNIQNKFTLFLYSFLHIHDCPLSEKDVREKISS